MWVLDLLFGLLLGFGELVFWHECFVNSVVLLLFVLFVLDFSRIVCYCLVCGVCVIDCLLLSWGGFVSYCGCDLL